MVKEMFDLRSETRSLVLFLTTFHLNHWAENIGLHCLMFIAPHKIKSYILFSMYIYKYLEYSVSGWLFLSLVWHHVGSFWIRLRPTGDIPLLLPPNCLSLVYNILADFKEPLEPPSGNLGQIHQGHFFQYKHWLEFMVSSEFWLLSGKNGEE